MYTVIRVKLNERVVVFRSGLPHRALGPGRHFFGGTRLTEQRWATDNLVFQALPEVRALLPADWFQEVTLGPRERGILSRDGQPRVFLRPGTHRYWTVDPSLRLDVLSIDAPVPDLTIELAVVLPDDEYVAEQPVLLRRKELESLKETASHIKEVRVVVGADGLKTLLPAGLLGESAANGNGKAEAK